jgi:hypothetical protein
MQDTLIFRSSRTITDCASQVFPVVTEDTVFTGLQISLGIPPKVLDIFVIVYEVCGIAVCICLAVALRQPVFDVFSNMAGI